MVVEMEIPQKLKCIWWLALEDKILTKHNLLKRRWQGPSFCPLCRQSDEIGFHLFLDCNLCLQVWRVVKECLGISTDWGAENLENSFSNWFQNDVSYNILLPIFISWSIWLTRNQAIILETNPISLICGIIGINLFKDYETINNKKFKKNVLL